MEEMKLERTIIEKGSFDVIVVGGGIAGVAAAVAAARRGAAVLLIEKSVNLGGLATSGLISWYEPLCDGKGRQMITGISEELIRLSCRYGFDNLPREWGGSTHNKKRNSRYSTYYSPGIFSAQLDDYCLENGVHLRFDTLATYPVMEGRRCSGVITESVSGSEYFAAGAVVDATGDATVMKRAGVPTVAGKNYMTYISHYFTMNDVEKLNQTGDLCAFRRWLNTGSDMLGNGHPQGMNMLSGETAEEITDYMITGKKRLLEKLSAMDKESYEIMTIPQMPQLRTIRRIAGKCDFNAVDGEQFEDSIGTCGDFRPGGIGNHYQIPFGSLFHEDFPNLIAAGRIISAPQGDGWEVARVIPVCALTGEAAGNAAALCTKDKKGFHEFNEDDIKTIKIN